MKIAYFDCGSGISGDMTLGALIDLGAPLEAIQEKLDSLKLPDCRLRIETVKRHGFRATKLHVDAAPEHKHRDGRSAQPRLAGVSTQLASTTR